MTDTSKYTGLITSQHANKPKFMAMVAGVSQPFVDLLSVLASIPASYDLDNAIGDQLDVVGEWVGISRNISTPLAVYFSLDTSGLGFDQGSWQGPYDPSTGLISLDDDTYRLLIRAKIGANSWDGTLGTSAAILNSIFGSSESLQPSGIVASGESFGTGDGLTKSFQLQYQGRPIFQISGSPSLYRNDWQGNQLLYSTPRTNLCYLSSALDNASWGKTRCLVTPNAAQAPDGTITADLVSQASTADWYPFLGANFIAGQAYCSSIYFKPSTGSTSSISLYLHSSAFGNNLAVAWDKVTDSLVSVYGGQQPAAYGLIKYPNGWRRMWAIGVAVTSGYTNYGSLFWARTGTFGSFNATADPIGEGYYLWGAQLETVSNAFSNAWGKSTGEVITDNAAIAPDGTNSASLLTTDGGSEYIYQNQTWKAGLQYTLSICVKMAGCNSFSIRSFQQSGNAVFQLDTGTSSGISGSCISQAITSIGNGWYICSATFLANADGSNNVGFTTNSYSYIGDAFYFWNAQYRYISSTTSYIPTYGTAVTITDYTVSTTGLVSLSSAPLSASALSWSGNGAIYPNDTFAFMQDNGDMSITVGVAGKTPSAVFMALLSHGYIPLKPSTVHVNAYLKSSVSGTPLFGFDVENQYISGFDVGSLGIAA